MSQRGWQSIRFWVNLTLLETCNHGNDIERGIYKLGKAYYSRLREGLYSLISRHCGGEEWRCTCWKQQLHSGVNIYSSIFLLLLLSNHQLTCTERFYTRLQQQTTTSCSTILFSGQTSNQNWWREEKPAKPSYHLCFLISLYFLLY